MKKRLLPLMVLVLFGAGCWSKPAQNQPSAEAPAAAEPATRETNTSIQQTVTILPATSTATEPKIEEPKATTAPKTTKPKTTAPKPSTSGSTSGGTTLPISAKVYVTVTDTGFSPQVIALSAGDTVVWTNKGTTGHSVFSDNALIFNGNLAPGASYSHVFKYPGSYGYHCGAHPNLKGTVVVR